MEAILDQFLQSLHEKGNLKMAAFRDTALSIIAQKMEAVRNSETWVYYNGSTQLYIQESCYLHTCRRENVKFHKGKFLQHVPLSICSQRDTFTEGNYTLQTQKIV
jgi:hypothetical protein